MKRETVPEDERYEHAAAMRRVIELMGRHGQLRWESPAAVAEAVGIHITNSDAAYARLERLELEHADLQRRHAAQQGRLLTLIEATARQHDVIERLSARLGVTAVSKTESQPNAEEEGK